MGIALVLRKFDFVYSFSVFSRYNLDFEEKLSNSLVFKFFESDFHNESIKPCLMSHDNNYFKWRIIRNFLYGPNEFKIGLDSGKKIIKKIEILDIIRPFGLDLIQVEKELHNIYIYEHATITDVSIKNFLLNNDECDEQEQSDEYNEEYDFYSTNAQFNEQSHQIYQSIANATSITRVSDDWDDDPPVTYRRAHPDSANNDDSKRIKL